MSGARFQEHGDMNIVSPRLHFSGIMLVLVLLGPISENRFLSNILK